MQAMIKKWGNSASIRIPTPILAEVGLTLDSPVEIFVLDGQIIIEPTQKMIWTCLSLRLVRIICIKRLISELLWDRKNFNAKFLCA